MPEPAFSGLRGLTHATPVHQVRILAPSLELGGSPQQSPTGANGDNHDAYPEDSARLLRDLRAVARQ